MQSGHRFGSWETTYSFIQTYRLGWTEQCKDGTKMGVGCPEYILLFRKLPTDHSKGYADVRVSRDKAD